MKLAAFPSPWLRMGISPSRQGWHPHQVTSQVPAQGHKYTAVHTFAPHQDKFWGLTRELSQMALGELGKPPSQWAFGLFSHRVTNLGPLAAPGTHSPRGRLSQPLCCGRGAASLPQGPAAHMTVARHHLLGSPLSTQHGLTSWRRVFPVPKLSPDRV